MRHDKWSKLGEEHLGEHNIGFAETMGPNGRRGKLIGAEKVYRHDGFFTLMKCIMNDYWADVPGGTNKHGWTAEHVDMVMSKLYYCWVRMLDEAHPDDQVDDVSTQSLDSEA